MRLEGLTAFLMKIDFFWDMTPSILVLGTEVSEQLTASIIRVVHED
jgi:hypothetical protein